MKSFFRENPTIAFGLSLPLLLAIVFLLLSGIPHLLVEDPKHDVIYATGYYNYQNGVQISVVGQKVQVIHQGSAQGNRKPRLWHYNSNTGAVKEIAIIVPSSLARAGKTPAAAAEALNSISIDVPDLKDLTVDASSIAPDGYEFRMDRDRYSGNVFGSLFYSSRYRHQAVLMKNGRSIRLPNATGSYYNQNTQFIGWVVSP